MYKYKNDTLPYLINHVQGLGWIRTGLQWRASELRQKGIDKTSPLPPLKPKDWLLPFFFSMLNIDHCEEPLLTSPAASACGWSLLTSHQHQLINLEVTFNSQAIFTKFITMILNVNKMFIFFFLNPIAPIEMTLWKDTLR